MSKATRQTAGERREAVLAAALVAFAQGGLYGTSTEDIARAAGISQPYLFRLFGTKKKLFVATVERCMADTLELFRAAAGDRRGEEALEAMGRAYAAMVTGDRTRLLAQLQAYAACDDPEVREEVRSGFGSLHLFVETVSGLGPETRGAVVREGDAPQRRRGNGPVGVARAVGEPPARGVDRSRGRTRRRPGAELSLFICPAM